MEELAPIGSCLAQWLSKGKQQSIIQQEMTGVCVARGLTPNLYSPAVTTGIKQLVASHNIAGNGPNNLPAGCQSFLVQVYTNQSDHYRAKDDVMVANKLD